MHIYDSKLIITEPKTFHFYFYLTEKVDKNLKLKIDCIIKHNGFLAEHRIKKLDWPIIVQI